MMDITGKQLAQSQPSGTSAVSVLNPSIPTVVKTIFVCNVDSTNTYYFSIYHDDNGTTYDSTTALFYSEQIQPNSTVEITTYIPVSTSGNVAVQTDTASKITFTFYGAEFT